jgi:hypothetical protein
MIYARASELDNESKMRVLPASDEKEAEPIVDVNHEDS